jgi:phage pi2 protein 07
MNIFKRLFNRTANTETLATKNPEINKQLFVEEEAPTALIQEELKESKLKIFLDTNFGPKGFNDGYELRSYEILQAGMKRIKSDFRLIVDQIIAEKNAEIFELKNHIINIDGVSEKLSKQIENRILEIQTVINKIEKEKALSIEDEGMVMVPINNYHDGFVRGTEFYQQEKLFAKSTGLFY